MEALSKALWSSRPEIFNTDQGVQFTAQEFSELLSRNEVKISMDGRGRVYDNILVERLWRTVKYEEVYLHEYQTVSEARQSLEAYFRFYNAERLHQGLGYRTPYEVYFGHTASKKFFELSNLNGLNSKIGRSKMHLKQASLLSKEWGALQELQI